VPTSPIYEGTLDALAIPHFLYRLAIHQSTGRLVLDSGSVNKEVWFRGGVPIQVKSSAIDELFGEMLVADSLVERSVLDGAIEECQRDGRPLGEVLVNAGALPPHRLLRLLEEQFRMRYLELFAWEAGTYAFFAGEPEPSDTTWMGTDPFELIAEGVRSHVGEDRLAAVYAPMMETPFVHRDNPHITHNNLRLSSRELRCYGYLADVSCLSAALEVCQDDERVSMFQVVFVLEQTCLLGFESTEP